MVSWTNLFPLDPQGGSVKFFGRAPGTSTPGFNDPWGYYGVSYYLSGGVVDVNIGSRFQYKYGTSTNITYWGPLIFDAADEAGRAGRTMLATAYLAPASAFAPNVVPTIAQIRAAAIQYSRLSSGRVAAGTLKTYGDMDITEANLTPNKKYWFALVPTYSSLGVSFTADTPIGDQNVNGRAVSFWTNRTPLAPKILSPAKRSTVRAGTEMEIKFEPQGADRIKFFPTDKGPNDFDDCSGFHAQYARVPEDGEEPVWMDLPLTNGMLAPPYLPEPGLGWFIDGASAFPPVELDGTPVPLPDTDPSYHRLFYGPYSAWRKRAIPLACGGPPPLSSDRPAYIPSGVWWFRVRTFDYGHPYPNSTNSNPFLGVSTYPALLDLTGAFTPESFPETNTSPWSEPIEISVSDQVPKPLLISPINSLALVEGQEITLRWQYRNTLRYAGADVQKFRTVQIRPVGDPDWVTLVDHEESPETSLVIYGFTPDVQYEWRVQTGDEWEGVSEFSDPGRFWVVPEPDSGSVIPDPTSSIEGATLGCGTHRVEVFRRGGRDHIGTLNGIVKVEWNRVRDEISTAEIVIEDWGIDCGNLLSRLKTWAYEIVIYRDNGYESVRVWEGPITLLTYETSKVVIDAKDVMAYLYRRIIKQIMRDSGDSETAGRSVVARAAAVVQNAFAPDDPNVLSYLQPLLREDDAKQYRNTPAYSRTAYEEIDDMASNAGLDYTAVGRAILLWGTKHRIGTLPEFRDADLGNSPIVSEYGMSGSNVYAVSDGNGVYGEASRIDDVNDKGYAAEDFGLIEMLSSTWASDSDSDQGTYTEAGLTEVRQSFADAADKSIDNRWPPPVVVRVPDNTALSADTVISINHLVPGVVIPLRSTVTLRQVIANQKLDSVKVLEESGKETITVTMSPFSRDDNEIEVAE